MSCLDKLKNIPGVAAIEGGLRSLTPSILDGQPLSQKIATAGKVVSGLASQIKENVTNEINNAVNAITGNINATVAQIQGIGASLKAIPQKVVNALESVAKGIAKSIKAVSDTVKCEINSLRKSNTNAYEASTLQTSTAAPPITLTNSSAKLIAENPAAKTALINTQTEVVKQATINTAAKTASNSTIYEDQVSVMNSLVNVNVL